MTSLPTRTDVLIVGAGPCGLAAAISLKLKGVEVTIVDQLVSQHYSPAATIWLNQTCRVLQEAGLNLSRALVVHAKTLEVRL
jgi:2-polyprenyl-6-methoxyphenol hydroxylase-like FAD-dependent oxidoreductase